MLQNQGLQLEAIAALMDKLDSLSTDLHTDLSAQLVAQADIQAKAIVIATQIGHDNGQLTALGRVRPLLVALLNPTSDPTLPTDTAFPVSG